MGHPNSTPKMRALAAMHKQLRVQPCWRCGTQIDYDAPPFTPRAYELGHKTAVSVAPHLATDPANVAPECFTCNRKNGTSSVIPLGSRSREW